MRLNMHILKDDLNIYYINSHINKNYELNLGKVKLLENSLDEVPEDDILYIATSDILESYSFKNSILNLALISNKSTEDFITKDDTNILVLSDELSSKDYLYKIMELFFEYGKWSDSIMDAIFSPNLNIEDVLKPFFEVLQNPIAVFDIGLNCISSYGKEYINDEHEQFLWKDICKFGYINASSLAPFIKTQQFLDKLKEEKVFIYNLKSINASILTGNIVCKNKKCGSIGITSLLSPITEKTLSLAILLCDYLSITFDKLRIFTDTTSELEQICIRMISGSKKNIHYSSSHLSKNNFNKDDTYELYVISVPSYNTKESLNPILNHIKNALNECISFRYLDYIIVLRNLKNSKDVSIKILNLINHLDCNCGVSNTFNGFISANIHNAYRQALIALDDKKLFFNTERISYFAHIETHYLMELLKEDNNIDLFCQSSINKLSEYDAKYNTKYVETTYNYILSGCNQIEASKLLGVHRNTLIYRLKKIEELLEEDIFIDKNLFFKLMLSCQIKTYIL